MQGEPSDGGDFSLWGVVDFVDLVELDHGDMVAYLLAGE